MATVLKVLGLVATIVLPGGLVVLSLYLLLTRRKSRTPELDFSAQLRRAPFTRDPRPSLIVPARLRA